MSANITASEWVAAAQDMYGSDDVQIDPDADLSIPKDRDGVFVQAWVWVPRATVERRKPVTNNPST